jgi:hypothetical protein
VFFTAGLLELHEMSGGQKPFTIKRWTIHTLVGWIIGIALLVLIAGLAEALKMGEDAQWMVGLGVSLGIGVMQWLALRKHIEKSSAWIWTTVVGMTLPWIAADTLRYFFQFRPDDQVLPATMVGACLLGWLQWRYVLRGANATSISWVLVTLVAWTMATLTVMLLGFYIRMKLPQWLAIPLAFITLFSGGVILGLVTGWKLKSILHEKQVARQEA